MSYLRHGVIDLLQLLIVVSRVSQRLHHDLLDLGEELQHTQGRMVGRYSGQYGIIHWRCFQEVMKYKRRVQTEAHTNTHRQHTCTHAHVHKHQHCHAHTVLTYYVYIVTFAL